MIFFFGQGTFAHSFYTHQEPASTLAPQSKSNDSESQTISPLIAALRKKVKHVFVLYQENRSFDYYFGTYPGAEGIYSHPAQQTPGFVQKYIGVDGAEHSVSPYRIGPDEHAADTDDVDHSHDALVSKMNLKDNVPQMDNYARAEEMHRTKSGNPSLAAVQYALLTMAHVDGDTIPLYWWYAKHFVLCDHMFQTFAGPSTPGNLSIIGAQTGQTQWMLHPELAPKPGPYSRGVPVYNDAPPFWGSSMDKSAQPLPYNPELNKKAVPQINLTYATIPLSTLKGDAKDVTDSDDDAAGDLSDVADDVSFLTHKGQKRVPWGWYQEGFDREPNEVKSDDPLDAGGSHASYVTHHNSPSFFGYISNNPKMRESMHGLGDFFTAVDSGTLPDEGVFYVKGGYQNILGMRPSFQDPKVQKNFVGDDDHPGYSDAQISECLIANTINKIAKSRYWKDCAIIVTWDDSEGDYDHVRPPVIAFGPDGKVGLSGPRVPMIVISPFAKQGAIFKEPGGQSSVVKFVDTVFNLTPLADLPDELKARKIGEAQGLKNEGPDDDLVDNVSNLVGCFDARRLLGRKEPIPASAVILPDDWIMKLPAENGLGLKTLGIVPTDVRLKIVNHIPEEFNPRPSTNPTKKK